MPSLPDILSHNHHGDAAQSYARLGWFVLAVHSIASGRCTCGAENCSSAAKHPMTPRGLHDATLDESAIKRLWDENPNANVGIRTGAISGLWVLDCDGPEGIEAIEALEREHGPLPATAVARTGGGGRHYFFQLPTDCRIANTTKVGGLSIDVRGDGGYVVAPPSMHRSGAAYEWLVSPDEQPPAQAPAWLLELVTRPTRPRGSRRSRETSSPAAANGAPCDAATSTNGVSRLVVQPGPDKLSRARAYLHTIDPAISGQGGHNQTFRAACAAVLGFDLAPEEAFPLLAEWNANCQPPWTDRELRHKLQDADRQPGERGFLLAGQANASPSATTADWPEILALGPSPVPDFPTDALPEVLRAWVEAEAVATQTPADLAGLIALAVCAASIARKVEVVAAPGWREPVNIYVAVLLEPGNRKSAVFVDATRPLRSVETELVASARPRVERDRAERRLLEKRQQQAEKLAAIATDAEKLASARCDALTLAEQLGNMPEPVLPSLIVDDVTSERLSMLLSEQGGRIASMSPEGGVFDLMAGMYSRSGMTQFGVYLMGHAGDDLRIDRIGRSSVFVPRPAITAAYAIQPIVITGLANKAAFRGRGLLARFLYSVPRSPVGYRDQSPPQVPEDVRQAYDAMVRTLAAIEAPTRDDGCIGYDLQLDSAAAEALIAWRREIEVELRDGQSLELIRDWGAKLAGATVRLAGVMHFIDHARSRPWEVPIGGPTMTAAVVIARYLIPHAEMVLSEMQALEPNETLSLARRVWGWITRRGNSSVTRRDLHRGLQRHCQRAEDLTAPLTELEKRGYLRQRSDASGQTGRPPSPVIEINPAALVVATAADGASLFARTQMTETQSGYGQHPIALINTDFALTELTKTDSSDAAAGECCSYVNTASAEVSSADDTVSSARDYGDDWGEV